MLQVDNVIPQLRVQSQEFRKTHLPVYHIIKSVIKDINEQSDEEIHRMRYGRISSTVASVSVELGFITDLKDP